MNYAKLFCVFCFCAVIAACGKPDLSRSQAGEQISSRREIQSLASFVPLQQSAVQRGYEQGLWILNQQGRIELRASKVVAAITQIDRNQLQLRTPARVVVNITGIADVAGTNNLKEVQFAWEYSNLPSIATRFALKGGNGQAIFRLFDDGWRVERVNTVNLPQPAGMSSNERRDEEADIAAENERRRQRQRAVQIAAQDLARRLAEQQQAAQIAAQKRARRLIESKTPTKRIEAIRFPIRFPDGATEQDIVVTDVSFQFRSHYGRLHTVWFGHIHHVGNGVGPLALITFRSRLAAYGHSSSMMFPIGNEEERHRFLTLLGAAVDSWRRRFADLPPGSLNQ